MYAQCTLAVRLRRENFLMENYYSENDVMVIVESGSFNVSADGKTDTVCAEEGYVFKKNTRYHRHMTEPSILHCFRFSCAKEIFGGGKLLFRDTARIRSTLSLFANFENKIYTDEAAIKNELFNDIVNQYILENSLSSSYDAVDDTLVADVLKKINRSPDILLETATDGIGISYVQFARRFKKAVKLSPKEYISLLRNKKAQELLTSTDMKIADIAYACGFHNEFYFSNSFKKLNGISPSDFRSGLTVDGTGKGYQ